MCYKVAVFSFITLMVCAHSNDNVHGETQFKDTINELYKILLSHFIEKNLY